MKISTEKSYHAVCRKHGCDLIPLGSSRSPDGEFGCEPMMGWATEDDGRRVWFIDFSEMGCPADNVDDETDCADFWELEEAKI